MPGTLGDKLGLGQLGIRVAEGLIVSAVTFTWNFVDLVDLLCTSLCPLLRLRVMTFDTEIVYLAEGSPLAPSNYIDAIKIHQNWFTSRGVKRKGLDNIK